MADWDVVSTSPIGQSQPVSVGGNFQPGMPPILVTPWQQLSPDQRHQHVVSFWQDKGVKPDVAAGIADALNFESGLSTTAVNPKSGATGLAQDLGDRKTALQNQPNWQDPTVQLANMYREVTGGDKQATQHWQEIQNAPDRATAKALWEKYFERPGAPAEAKSGGWDVVSGKGWNVDPKAISTAQGEAGTDVVYMTPADYLALTPETTGDKAQKSALQKSIDAGESILDLPDLQVSVKDGKATVTDQDGRNRAMAAQKAGVDLIPVAIRGVGTEAPKSIIGMRGGDAQPWNFQSVPKAEPQGRSALMGVGEGAMDPIYGAAQLIGKASPAVSRALASGLGRATGTLGPNEQATSMDALVREREAEIAASRGPDAGTDWARLGGNVAAGAALGAAIPGAGMLAEVAGGAATGALSPVTDPGNFWQQKAEQAGVGALTAGALRGAGNLAGKIVSPMPLRPSAQQLVDAGVRLTPGQAMGNFARDTESKFGSHPTLGGFVGAGMRRAMEDFNRAAYDRVLEPIGASVSGKIDPGTKAIDEIGKIISHAYDSLLPYLHFRGDKQWLQDLQDIAKDAQLLPADQQRQLQALFKSSIQDRLGPGGTMGGQAFKRAESEITYFANAYQKSNNPAFRQLGRLADDLNAAMRENLERHSPAVRDLLRKVNTSWAGFSRLQDAAANRVRSLGVFTPGDLLTAEKRAAGKRLFSRGKGLLQGLASAGQDVLSAYPDSGTAGRSAALALLGGHFLNPAFLAGLLPIGAYTGAGMSALRHYMMAMPQVRGMLRRGITSAAELAAPGAALAGANAFAAPPP